MKRSKNEPEKGKEGEKDPFDVFCYNTSQVNSKGLLKNITCTQLEYK